MSHGMIRLIATLFLAFLSLVAHGVEEVIYYHNDALGSPIIATDQEGHVVWRKSYAPYGQPIGQTAPDEPGYTGKFEEPDLGIQNFGARWYDPGSAASSPSIPPGSTSRTPRASTAMRMRTITRTSMWIPTGDGQKPHSMSPASVSASMPSRTILRSVTV